MCVCVCFRFPDPTLVFADPKHFIVNCEENVIKFAGKWGKMFETCKFYVKYFDKIKCNADRPNITSL